MGILDLALGSANPVASYADTNRSWLSALGAGLGSGQNFSQGLSNAAQLGPAAQAQDYQRGLQQNALTLQVQQRDAAADWVSKLGHPELAAAIKSGAISGSDAFSQLTKQTVVPPGSSVIDGQGKPVGTPPSGYAGTSLPEQNWNLVMQAQSGKKDWNDPQVQAAWAQLNQPTITYQQTPQGLVPIYKAPNLPAGWGPPSAAPAAPAPATQPIPGNGPVAPQAAPSQPASSDVAPIGSMAPQNGFSVGQPLAGTATPLTQNQSTDVYYATNAEGAMPVLDKLGGSLTSLGQDLGSKVLGPTLGNFVKSGDYQQAEQAGRVFINAIERKESGAAIGATENETYGRTFLPQPGDKPATLQQKAIARQRAIIALKAGMPPQAILEQAQAEQGAPSMLQPDTSSGGQIVDLGNGVTIQQVGQ